MKKQCWHEHGGTACRTTRNLYGAFLGIQSGPRCGPLWWSKGYFIERFVITVGLWEISQRLRLHHHNVCQQARALALVLQDQSTGLNMTSRSGSGSASGEASTSLSITSQSGRLGAAAVDDPSSQRMTSQSGRHGAAVVGGFSSQRMTSSSGSAGEHAAAERGSNVSQSNSWNDFQREFAR